MLKKILVGVMSSGLVLASGMVCAITEVDKKLEKEMHQEDKAKEKEMHKEDKAKEKKMHAEDKMKEKAAD